MSLNFKMVNGTFIKVYKCQGYNDKNENASVQNNYSVYVSESSSESDFSSILNVVFNFFFILLQVSLPDSDILALLPPILGLLPNRLCLLPSRLRLLPPILLPGKLSIL